MHKYRGIFTLAYCRAFPAVEIGGWYLKIPVTNHLLKYDTNQAESLFHVMLY